MATKARTLARVDQQVLTNQLLVGATSFGVNDGLIRSWGVQGVTANMLMQYDGTGSHSFASFANGSNTVIGGIATNGTTTAYNTSSDYRLKHDIQPMTGALAKVAQLKPCTYKWNADDSQGEGFIAHELQQVVPGCVTGEKDGVDEDGQPHYQAIDTSFLVATLTAAMQEQQTIIEQLKARVEALEHA